MELCPCCGFWVNPHVAFTKVKNGVRYYYHRDCYYFD